MSETDILNIAQQAMLIVAKLAGPMLAVSLAVGVFISLVQAVTSVQEMTLTFVPKLMGIALVLVLGGSWMLGEISTFTTTLYRSIPQMV